MIAPHLIQEKLEAALPGAQIDVRDLTGTMNHYEVVVISDAFEGKTLIKRHSMVYDALAEEMKGPIHALTLQTLTTAQADK